MKNHIKIIVLALSAIVIYSCQKEDIISNSTKKQFALKELLKNMAPPMQTFTVSAGSQTTIVGEKGTNITFYSNSFKKRDGSILTTGQVKIILQEMLTGPEMILAGKSTTSDGKLLISGGQFFIKATFNNEELLINTNASPIAKIPMGNQGSMDLFKGIVNEDDSIVGDTSINWEKLKDSVTIRQDSIINSSGVVTFDWTYSFGFEEFGYYNCDKFYDWTSPRTEIKIKTPAGFNDTNTQVYIYFKSINSVIKCEGYDRNSNQFFINHGNAPIGLDITIVIVAKKESKYYLEVKPNITITDGYTTMANPTESTEAAIKLAIKSL